MKDEEWVIDNTGYFTRIGVVGEDVATICSFPHGANGNAHLIAAAPSMYKALEALSKGEGLQPGTTIESILIKARGE